MSDELVAVIIEDSEIHREWLKRHLIDHGINVVCDDCQGRSGIESVKMYSPDMVFLDFQLMDMTGMEVARRIKKYNPNIKVFMITAHSEVSIVERMLNDRNIDAIAIKGSSYFESNLLIAIESVYRGDNYIDPSLLGKLRESKNSNGISSLTKREFEIFIQTNFGKSDDNIAMDLNVEISHIKNLKSRIFKKVRRDESSEISNKLIENLNHSNVSSLM